MELRRLDHPNELVSGLINPKYLELTVRESLPLRVHLSSLSVLVYPQTMGQVSGRNSKNVC